MFTQMISMDCTKEQYIKYLKEELLKMGYNYAGDLGCDDSIIVNNYSDTIGEIRVTTMDCKNNSARTYLGSFNAPLFLALAAMTDRVEGNYGEYIIGLGSGRLYKMREEDKILPEYNMVRKATKEELMEKFGNLKSGSINVEASIDTKGILSDISKVFGATEATEIDAINLLKSKGYKILKPKTWEEV